MDAEVMTRASGWRAEPVGPWERHRQDLDGGRVLTVALGMDGRWTWDLWANREYGQCLDMALEGFGTVDEAKADADRAAAKSAAMTDEQLVKRNGIGAYRELAALRLVTVERGKRCAFCGNEIVPGAAAEQTEGEPWLWCGSCASRNPDAVLTGGVTGSI